MSKINGFVTFSALVVCLLSSICHADFSKALNLYQSGDFEKAKISFEALAEIGDKTSLFNLGVMYFRGEAVDKDSARAYVMMKIANADNDENFSRITKAVYSQLDESQIAKTKTLFVELNEKYSSENIESRIFPKPLNDEDCIAPIIPIKQVKPTYPRSAQRVGQYGLVAVEMTISPEGYPRDILVPKYTSKEFLKPTIKAVTKSSFDSPINGKPIHSHRTNYIFRMAGDGKLASRTRKKLSKQLDELHQASELGDAIAQYNYASGLNTFRHFKTLLRDVDLQYKTANKWLVDSAKRGLPNAQFDLGRNMLIGRGCEVDKVNGFKWITAAAVSGFSPAQNLLAQTALDNTEEGFNNSEAAIAWLENAAIDGGFASVILLAWELSTSNVAEIRDGRRALELLERSTDQYYDELRIVETQAAAYASTGDFKKAVKLQNKAVELAQDNNWDIPLVSERLDLYKNNQMYLGPYY